MVRIALKRAFADGTVAVAELLPRLTALLEEMLAPATTHTSLDKAPSS